MTKEQYFNYNRRQTVSATVGNVVMGGNWPLRLQSMTTTATTDVMGSVEQCKTIIDAGADLVRLTTQGTQEANSLTAIRKALRQEGYTAPLVADVHFNPAVADLAAEIVEGVRINPGNYVDASRTFKQLDYTDEEYAEEIQKIEKRLLPFLQICKTNHTAVRVGVNHGSLSDRIMSRYGNTPEGIVESCMEFLRIFKKENFKDVVVSIKASDTAIMVQSVRLLEAQMQMEDMNYPLHLGVTEAGEGEDGRIKSAVGIGALLTDGMGDTIRVSLSEAPENEIPVARKLVSQIEKLESAEKIEGEWAEEFNYANPQRRPTHCVGNVGGDCVPVVIADYFQGIESYNPDYIYCGDINPKTQSGFEGGYIVDAEHWKDAPKVYPAFCYKNMEQMARVNAEKKFLFLPCQKASERVMQCLKDNPNVIVIAQTCKKNKVGAFRALIHQMWRQGVANPVILYLSYQYDQQRVEDFQLESAMDCGAVMFDGLCDGLYLNNQSLGMNQNMNAETTLLTAFSLLQSAGLRRTRTEYISCPGCGRTLYDLGGTIAKIKSVTKGLPNLKIAIMGCIVNGPGEMAGADYGYVGAARGKISLYRGKECIEKNIPEEEAVEHLLELLRKDGYEI